MMIGNGEGFVLFLLILQFGMGVCSNYFKPFSVSYDHRTLIIDGKRRILNSAAIHYARAAPEMWADLIAKSREGGVDVIESYVFWNMHETVRGKFDFEGKNDIVKFVKLVGASGLYFHLRLGPYICAEWNFGGLPVWLRDVPGIVFRTDNAPFKEEMERFVKKIVDLMRDEGLFSWQGGPIIKLQIENEYGLVERFFGESGKIYIDWVAKMAMRLNAGVPMVMCQQWDAPETTIGTCNGFYCDGFKPNSQNRPTFWTENWAGWYASWGERLPHRPAEDVAFAVARFFQRGGSFQNYYMYFGGTNFGRTTGGPFYITSYEFDSPIDEYGLISQPKWGHLKDLHAVIKLCEPALVASDSPQYIKLGPLQEAHVYRGKDKDRSRCCAFISNTDTRGVSTVDFFGQAYSLPPWSVSILPDCRNVVFNTAKVLVQTSIKSEEIDRYRLPNSSLAQKMSAKGSFTVPKSWMSLPEAITLWAENSFTAQGILEHLNVTKDQSDYLWQFTSLNVSHEDIDLWRNTRVGPTVMIDHMRDVLRIFVNGKLAGTEIGKGRWVKVARPIQLVEGHNELVLLSQTMGLQNFGAYMEKDGAGLRGNIRLTGFKNGDIDLSKLSWTYQVGLKGESEKVYTVEETEKAEWTALTAEKVPSMFTWYKAWFDSPQGVDPVALDLGSMGKGQAWVNGHHIGRYWTLVAPSDGCEPCDYRGLYALNRLNKCATRCGRPTQDRFHVPRSWLQASNNLLVVFEETGGNPFGISVKPHSSEVICGRVSETDYPPLWKWSAPDPVSGVISANDTTPEMNLQCDDGRVISSIEFASYGTPEGTCGNFQIGRCHTDSSMNVVAQACQGKKRCSIKISSAEFGDDPCSGIAKTLAVQASCSSISSAQEFPYTYGNVTRSLHQVSGH